MNKFKKSSWILWISLWNPFFTELKIKEIIDYWLLVFDEVNIIIPSELAKYNYLALWYSENKSITKSRLSWNRINNMIDRILSFNNYSNINIINWNDSISHNANYLDALKTINDLFENNLGFKNECLDVTYWVLKTKNSNNLDSEELIKIWVKYLLSELACLISLPNILDSKITYMYHLSFPIYEKLISGKYDNINYWNNYMLILTKDL